MLIFIIIFILFQIVYSGKYDVQNCFRYKSLIYNAPCIQCKAGFQLIKDENYCKQCKDRYKEMNGKCVRDYSYQEPKQQIVEEVKPLQTSFLPPTPPFQPQVNEPEITTVSVPTGNMCIQTNFLGRCSKCQNGYELNINNFCQPISNKRQTAKAVQQKEKDNRQNCRIYDQVDRICLKCIENYQQDALGFCFKSQKKDKILEEEDQIIKKPQPQFCADYFDGQCWACIQGYLLNRIKNQCTKIENQQIQEDLGQSFLPKQPFVEETLPQEDIQVNFMNDTKTNKTNVTNETNVTDVVEEVIVYPENYEDLNCEKFSADQRFCEKCKFFFYFDKTEIICKMVNPLCKSYDQSNGDCTNCYFGYVLNGIVCEINI